MIKGIICRLFHKIEFLNNLFTDKVSGQPVNLYYCSKCEIKFMANSPTAMFRVIEE